MKKVSASGATLYLGPDIERNVALTWTKYPHPDAVRVGNGTNAITTWLTRDHSQSIRLRSDATGALTQATGGCDDGIVRLLDDGTDVWMPLLTT